MMQITQDKPNVAILVSMPIYCNGYMYTRVKLFSITIWCQPHLKLTSAIHWKRTCCFHFSGIFNARFCLLWFWINCAGLGIWPFLVLYGSLEHPAKWDCHDPFFLVIMIVTNKKCFTVTSWPFYTVDQAELRGIIYFNFLNCGVFSLLTICQKISHGNSFIWWLQSAVS